MRNKAQGILEYVVLVMIIAAAVVAMSHYIQRAAKGKLRAIELEVNPKIKIVEVPAAALAGTGEAAGLPEGIMLPAGWTYDPGQVLSFCDTVTGKCYDEEYMKRQQSGVRKLDF